jgi:hypothetical protein
MKLISENYHLSFQKFFQRLSERLYVPSQTGSHDIGNQYLGDLASSYTENKDFPLPTSSAFRGITISKR